MFKRNVLAVSLSLGLAAVSGQVMADAIGGGATLPAGVFNEIITDEGYAFEAYIGVGSSGGKRAFFNNDSTEFGYTGGETVHYAGSDSVASSSEISNYATNDEALYGMLIQVPFAGTSVTVPYNNSDLTALNLTSSQLAKIFSGQITDWADPALGLTGVTSKQITVVYRTDGSGTVEIFTRHLAAVEPSLFQTSNNFLLARVGTPDPSAVFVGASGSSGVVSAMNGIDGAITFVSPDYVDAGNAMEVAAIENQNDSTHYLPTQVNVQATFAAATPPATTNTNPADWAPVFPDPSAGYPIAGFTFMLLSQCYSDNAIGTEIGNFMLNHYTGFHDGYVSGADLVPLPTSWQNAVLNTYALSIDDAMDCAGIGR